MATRGIYHINGFYIYNHWDNYPDGAREHIRAAVLTNRSLTEAFLQVNQRSELISHRHAVGGEEYFYTIETKTNGELSIKYDEISPVDDSIVDTKIISDPCKWLGVVYLREHGYIDNTSEAIQTVISAKFSECVNQLSNGWTGNAHSVFTTLSRWVHQTDRLDCYRSKLTWLANQLKRPEQTTEDYIEGFKSVDKMLANLNI